MGCRTRRVRSHEWGEGKERVGVGGRKRLPAVLVAEGGGWVSRPLYSVIKLIYFCRGHLWQEAQPRADGPVTVVLKRDHLFWV